MPANTAGPELLFLVILGSKYAVWLVANWRKRALSWTKPWWRHAVKVVFSSAEPAPQYEQPRYLYSALWWVKSSSRKRSCMARVNSITQFLPVTYPFNQMGWAILNEWIFYSSTQIQYSKNSKEQNCVDWTERLEKHLQLPWPQSIAVLWLVLISRPAKGRRLSCTGTDIYYQLQPSPQTFVHTANFSVLT